MGFLDHLFKLKPNDEKAAHGEKGGNGAGSNPAPDPGAFLHPKYFVPRGLGVLPPAPPNGRAAECPSPSETRAQEIVLTLGDVLARIPTPLLRAGLHDATRELRFAIDDLSSDIARGRAAVPLSKIAALCPDVFARPVGPDDETEIRLPLQKLVEQIGLLRNHPAPAAPELPVLPAATEAAVAKDSPPAEEPVAEIIRAGLPPQIAPAETPSPTPPPPASEPAPVAVLFRPPPIMRPVLAQPPPILASAELRAEPQISSAPHPRTALQNLFATDEPLDLAAVCRHPAALPGVRACAIEVRGETALAGNAPNGFDHAALHAAAARLRDAGTLPLGNLESVTLLGDQAAISIFTHPGVLLAVLRSPFPPDVHERLAAIATELARPPNLSS